MCVVDIVVMSYAVLQSVAQKNKTNSEYQIQVVSNDIVGMFA